jgi:uncharacterized membrane protein YgcG
MRASQWSKCVYKAWSMRKSRETRQLAAVERGGLAQMIIYIVPALPVGGVLEELTLRSSRVWGVGRAGVDDGLVIFVFVADRKVRIELGYGLERAISNEAAGRVIAEQIAPSFRRGAYAEGLRNAVQELSRLLSAVESATPSLTFGSSVPEASSPRRRNKVDHFRLADDASAVLTGAFHHIEPELDRPRQLCAA